ncbi:hypothetical protein AGMMS49579_00990 [Spirochaetia bacterium]|nr:hypothetical protein AGMMS49579_00990 [Spirochaetia bacterium]
MDYEIITKTFIVKSTLNKKLDEFINKPSKSNMLFKNSFTIKIDKVSLKVCSKGSFQITGCKTTDHAIQCIKKILDISELKNNKFTFIPVMTNIKMYLDYKVDINKALYILNNIEPSIFAITLPRNSGLNIKIIIPVTDLLEYTKRLSYKETTEFITDVKIHELSFKKPYYSTIMLYSTSCMVISCIHENIINHYLFKLVLEKLKTATYNKHDFI